jgi:hypothetical protein
MAIVLLFKGLINIEFDVNSEFSRGKIPLFRGVSRRDRVFYLP